MYSLWVDRRYSVSLTAGITHADAQVSCHSFIYTNTLQYIHPYYQLINLIQLDSIQLKSVAAISFELIYSYVSRLILSFLVLFLNLLSRSTFFLPSIRMYIHPVANFSPNNIYALLETRIYSRVELYLYLKAYFLRRLDLDPLQRRRQFV